MVLVGLDRGPEAYVDALGDDLLGEDVGDVAADRAHRPGQVRAAHRRRRDLGDDVAVGRAEPQVAEGEAVLGEPVVDADRLEGLERVALQRDAVADPAEGLAQVDEHDRDATLAQGQGEDAAGDAAADDEDALDGRSLGLGHGNSDGSQGGLVRRTSTRGIR